MIALELGDRLLAKNRGEKTRKEAITELRVELLRLLAPSECCAKCAEPVGVERLEIDHVDGCTWSRRGVYRCVRVIRYWTEYLSGVRLRALCRSCNAIDGNRRRWKEAT